MYETSFEDKFIRATDILYAAEGDRLMQETDVSSAIWRYIYCTPGGYDCASMNND